MDGPPAQSLGVEPVDPDVMSRPPRPRGSPALTPLLLRRVLTNALIITIGTMAVYIHEMTTLDSPTSTSSSSTAASWKVTRRDTTMTFTTFVLFDMFNALNCRSESKSFLRGEVKIFGNRMFNWAVGCSLAGQALVIYFPWLQEVFQTEALGVRDLLGLILLTSSVFWAEEARKWWVGRGGRRLGGGYSGSV